MWLHEPCRAVWPSSLLPFTIASPMKYKGSHDLSLAILNFGFCANAGWSTLIESDPQPVIYFSGYNILLLSWSRWRHNASGFKRSNGLPGARLAERLTWQPINHSAKHASPHHRRRMWLYSMKKHICAPTPRRIVSKSKTRFSTCIALGIVVLEPTSILSFLIIKYASYFCLHRSY